MKPLSLVVFRVDASLSIGSGHLMRCLTLASALAVAGARCVFISRSHPGNLHELVRSRGFQVIELAADDSRLETGDDFGAPTHAHWLGCDWQADARQTRAVLDQLQSDWLVTDHYALDARWETELAGSYTKLLVIDDLADRPHACDVLLDQNLGRMAADYVQLVPARCKVLVGPEFALLRPEFAALRSESLARPRDAIRKLLITMGGVDQPNATGTVLTTLKECYLPDECQISVVMGRHAPWLEQIQAMARQMPWRTEVLINIDDMGRRMVESDLAIGAAGSTSWERCCLGLPSLIVVLAENQWPGARALDTAQAVRTVGEPDDISARLPALLQALGEADYLLSMGAVASKISDGTGVAKLVRVMETINED
jgi:UDP-2,4-diacetamido-2,4,6-trideoxy-beta-L-altropyranose hydrolase